MSGRWCFWLSGTTVTLSNQSEWQLLHKGPHSYIYTVQEPLRCYVAKVVAPRSKPRDNLRKYVHCQARREYRSALTLQALGIETPTVLGWGLSLRPGARFESILFMDRLPPCTAGLTFLRREKDSAARAAFLERFARELARVHASGLIHKDCHFNNLCIDRSGGLIWVDNDIRRRRNTAGQRTGLKKTMTLLAATAGGDISKTEMERFKAYFDTYLATHMDD